MTEKNDLEKMLQKGSAYSIYGAGIVATSIYTAIKVLYKRVPQRFIVSAPDGNPTEIDGIKVIPLAELTASEQDTLYLIAAPQIHHQTIAAALCAKGIGEKQLVYVDNEEENRIMEAYESSLLEPATAERLLKHVSHTAEDKAVKPVDIQVFQAKCHVDKPLQNKAELPAYVCPIQVGAALTDTRITDIRDNQGENISHKNRNYCELTASYYAWKHSNASYKGLCHYRRIFDLTDKKIQALLEKNYDIDVILPYPAIHYPDISGQHTRYVKTQDWEAMLRALKEKAPEYYAAYNEILRGQYFYHYNMLIARKEIFDEYCDFLFTVLQRTEELTTPKGCERADRFAGYLGENLTTLYFRKNRDRFHIVHTGKLWLL